MNLKKITAIVSIIIILLIILRLTLLDLFSFDQFLANREILLQMVNNNYLVSILSFSIIYILTVVLTLPLAGPLTVIGGFLFRPVFGTMLAVISGTIGSAISVLIFRYFMGNLIQKKYNKKLETFNNNIKKYGGVYVIIVQLTGLIPFSVINILVSLTKISLKTFIFYTALGITPINFIYAFAGNQLSNISSFSEILSTKFLVVLFLICLIIITSLIIKRYRNVKSQNLDN